MVESGWEDSRVQSVHVGNFTNVEEDVNESYGEQIWINLKEWLDHKILHKPKEQWIEGWTVGLNV